MVKLFFSEDVSGEETQKANKDKIALKDSDGKAVDFEILYDSKDSKKNLPAAAKRFGYGRRICGFR